MCLQLAKVSGANGFYIVIKTVIVSHRVEFCNSLEVDVEILLEDYEAFQLSITESIMENS